MDLSSRAVIFHPSDYASFGRRVLACLVDAGIVIAVAAAIQLGFAYKYVPPDVRAMPRSPATQKLVNKFIAPHMGRIAILNIAVFAIYFVPIAALPGGTLGYRLARFRLVNHLGQVPSWWQLIKRLLIVGLIGMLCSLPYGLVGSRGGGVSPVIQIGALLAGVFAAIMLLYRGCSTQERRQAVHDQWSGTWMVRKNASPIDGVAFYKTVLVGTFPVRYLDVAPVIAARPVDETVAPQATPPITTDAR